MLQRSSDVAEESPERVSGSFGHASLMSSGIADRWHPPLRADDRDYDGIPDFADRCLGTTRNVTVDRSGCRLFDTVLEDVVFKSGSDWLTPRARAELESLADKLLVFPEVRIQVRAHTDSVGSAAVNLALSARRAKVVVQFLQSRGVHPAQLEALGMGESQPRESNETASGRSRNRRIVVVSKPDRDAVQPMQVAGPESAEWFPGAGLPVTVAPVGMGSDLWNTAKYPETSSFAFTSQFLIAEEPGLFAAVPYVTSLQVPVKPLPRPGKAEGFAASGVVQGLSFAPGVSTLSEDARQALRPLLDAMLGHPQVKIAVMAHTDNLGSERGNQMLSLARAKSVVNYLVSFGVNPDRMKAEGYGEMLPVVQNVTMQDRARNRRVEVRVLMPQSD
ncbi:MAG: OmpA family protein [Granulosicoccus sp.]